MSLNLKRALLAEYFIPEINARQADSEFVNGLCYNYSCHHNSMRKSKDLDFCKKACASIFCPFFVTCNFQFQKQASVSMAMHIYTTCQNQTIHMYSQSYS